MRADFRSDNNRKSDELDYEALGIRIATERRRQSLTQAVIHIKTGISTTHLSHIENGMTKVSLPSLVRIANALHTTLDALVYDSLNAVKDAYDKDFHDLIQGCSVRERAAIYRAAEQMKDTLKK